MGRGGETREAWKPLSLQLEKRIIYFKEAFLKTAHCCQLHLVGVSTHSLKPNKQLSFKQIIPCSKCCGLTHFFSHLTQMKDLLFKQLSLIYPKIYYRYTSPQSHRLLVMGRKGQVTYSNVRLLQTGRTHPLSLPRSG